MARAREKSGRRRTAREFEPGETQAALASFDRRTFLKLMGAGAALAGSGSLAGCWKPQPVEYILPYVDSPEGEVPGIPRFYASGIPTGGFTCGLGRGVIVEHHEGRPTKIEGNPRHPSSLGGTDTFMQAAILQLYDPDRSRQPLQGNDAITWGGVLGKLRQFIHARGGAEKLRLRLLTGTLASPQLADQLAQLRTIYPNFQWHEHEASGRENSRAGLRRALGRPVTPLYDFTQARRILSLDAHFLAEEVAGGCAAGGSVRYAREFAHHRRIPFHDFGPNQTHSPATPAGTQPTGETGLTPQTMTRLYVVETTPTFTGAVADHRLGIRPAMLAAVAAELARGIQGNAGGGSLPDPIANWVRAAAADLKEAGNAALVLAGESAAPEIHALAVAINARLGSIGHTVRYLEPVETLPDENAGTLAALTQAMQSGDVDLLLILDTNPAFTASGDIPFASTLEDFSRDPNHLALHLGGWVDETATRCTLHVPLAHALEAWGDVRGHDGTISLIQPMIEPLFSAKSAPEMFAALLAIGIGTGGRGSSDLSAGDLYAGGYELLRRFWTAQWSSLSPGDREMRWRKALRDGILENTAAPEAANLQPRPLETALTDIAALEKAPIPGSIEISFRPDPALGDGRWANHPWMQELPKPITHLTWDTVALLSPATATRLGIRWNGHDSREEIPVLKFSLGQAIVEMPAWIEPSQPEGVICLHFGGGRSTGGQILQGVGADVYPLRRQSALWSASDIRITLTKKRHAPACTRPQQVEVDRDIVRSRTLDQLPAQPTAIQTPDLYSTTTIQEGPDKGKAVHLSLYEEYQFDGYKWGMVVDLSACIGCGTCVIACQSENNSPTVGKEQVRRGREMHWMRIDSYQGDAATRSWQNLDDNPRIRFQPMFCQHCENAPCEVVCPVEATSHSDEGINEMTYNRCIGTRYCSNNCPYKVRRFNFLQYNPHDVLTLNMQKNPNVTVRSRGVMEKCTFCIQRINIARIDAKKAWAQEATAAPELRKAVEMRTPAPDPYFPVKPLPRMRLQTACQQACPTEALIFGDINDTAAAAYRLKYQQPWAAIDYGVLAELNTQTRTSYLERIDNPNPAIKKTAGGAS